MSDKEFPRGIFANKPHDNAPQFVICGISINRKEFGSWLMTKSDEWINFQAKVSKEGRWYIEVDTWKPKQGGQQATKQDDFKPDADIPF